MTACESGARSRRRRSRTSRPYDFSPLDEGGNRRSGYACTSQM